MKIIIPDVTSIFVNEDDSASRDLTLRFEDEILFLDIHDPKTKENSTICLEKEEVKILSHSLKLILKEFS
jgi:hypothetical protein